MYKAIFVDIDGTILNSNKELINETKNAIKKAKENGIDVIICTGRQYNACKNFAEECDMNPYMICTNGAEIYDSRTNDVLYSSEIDVETCLKLYDIAKENDIVAKFDCKYGRFVYNSDNLISTEFPLNQDINEFLSENKITQISMGVLDRNKIEKVKSEIKLASNLKFGNEFIWSVDDIDFYMIICNNPTNSKGNAMMGLCKFLKLDLKDVVAVGDGVNDISMIQNAGFGVAMGNAYDDVKQVADYITDTNDNCGVAKLIEKILSE